MHCPLRTPPHVECSRHHRCTPATGCNRARRIEASYSNSNRRRRRAVAVSAAAKTLYETLGVSQDASEREIKRAYRQKALKLHPDVNRAPGAQEQFLEVKDAFQVLSDAQQRAQYDRKLQGGFGDFGSWGSYGTWGGSSSSTGSTGSRPRPKQQEEEFYGLEDFFKDLDKELDAWSKTRSSSGKPASLWEELAAIGEEFVDFLEQGLTDEQRAKAGKEGSSGGSSSSFNNSSRAKSPVDKFEQLKRQYDLYDDANKSKATRSSSSSAGGSTGSSSTRAANVPPQKTADEEIDDMLAALKKKMNKQ